MLFSDLKHEKSNPQITFLPNLHQGKHAAFSWSFGIKLWFP